ncbi:MAG: class I SAM-dependent methyltransferase [Hypericibacter sp.]
MSDDRVREQYEAYPYPPRDPREETKRLIEGSPSHRLEIDHYLFAGQRDWQQPFRALVAGGGTGDGLVMLAQQLADAGCPAEIHYLDLSHASRNIAEARIRARELQSVTFHAAAIEDLPRLGLGNFDYIDCCGVLHHLADPLAGLRILREALSPTGGIGLMVYGELGRSGVYPMQDLLKMLGESDPAEKRIETAKRLLRQLPSTNLFARNPVLGDHMRAGDAGIHDLLLHARDRAYRVPELVALIDAAGLAPTALIEPWRYDPASYLADQKLLAPLNALDRWQRAAAAELLAGNLKTHIVYAVPKGRATMAVADAEDVTAVPVLKEGNGVELARGLRPGGKLTVKADGYEARFATSAGAGPILAAIDGRRSIAQIAALLAEQNPKRWTPVYFTAEFTATYRLFNALNRLFLSRAP